MFNFFWLVVMTQVMADEVFQSNHVNILYCEILETSIG